MIRVLHVFGQMNLGGAEVMIMNIYREVDRSQFQFDFVVHTDKECVFDREILSLGGRILRVPRYTVSNHLQYVKAWRELLEQNRDYRIIHTHIRSTASLFLPIARRLGMTTIVHSHSTATGSGIKGALRSLLQRPLRKSADLKLACSTQSGEWLFGRGSDFHVVNNPVDLSKFEITNDQIKSLMDSLGLGNERIILHVGRFNEAKNHKFLLEIFERFTHICDNAILLLVGSGELMIQMENQVERMGLSDRVRFLGTRRDVNVLMRVADAMVFPSLWEGFPVTLVEAQAAGLPTLISDVITDDVMLTPMLTKLSLKASPERWAEELMKLHRSDDQEFSLVGSDYDAKCVASEICNYYGNVLT